GSWKKPRHDDTRRSYVLGQFPQGRPTPSPYQTTTPSTSHPNSSSALGATQKAYDDDGKKNHNNAADPYMTLLGYFNSLRELGGSRRIVEDEVNTRLTGYVNRKRIGQKDGLFVNR